MEQTFRLKNAVLLMALAAAYPLQAHALAGIAQFTAGEVNLRQTDGRVTALAKGSNIDSGNAIVTGNNGRAQVKFTDGGLISLQPNTEFKISNYVDQNNPKEDRFLVDLLRGSMRAITGLIGKRNRDNYKLTTTTATIGIRGSGFKVGYNPDGTLGITSELDKIEVCNQSGCIGLVAGESVRVIDSATPPVRTSEQPKVETPSTEKDPVVVGDKVNREGKSEIVEAVKPATAATSGPTTSPNSGTFTDMTVVSHYHLPPVNTDPNGSFAGPIASLSVVMDAGKVTEFEASGSVFKPALNTAAGSFGSTTTNDFIGWGNWATGMKDGTTNLAQVHYLVGQATPVLPTTVGAASYTLIGGSAPTSYTGTSGTLNSASFSVNFDPAQIGGPMLSVNINTSFGNVIENFVYFSSSSFSSGSGKIKGMFTGLNAERAGVVYTGGLSPAGSYSGTAIFQKP
jgi:hypothetical protein